MLSPYACAALLDSGTYLMLLLMEHSVLVVRSYIASITHGQLKHGAPLFYF
jgi:hypothetical protein